MQRVGAAQVRAVDVDSIPGVNTPLSASKMYILRIRPYIYFMQSICELTFENFYQRKMIDTSLLTREVKNYNDKYHSRVWDTISTYLDQPKDSAALDWLRYDKCVYIDRWFPFLCKSLFHVLRSVLTFSPPTVDAAQPPIRTRTHTYRCKASQDRLTETALFLILVIRLVAWTERCPKIKGGPQSDTKAHLAIACCHAALFGNTKSRGFWKNSSGSKLAVTLLPCSF